MRAFGRCDMELKELANAIGMTTEYPAAMDEIYARLPDIPACDLQVLDRLQETYHLFGRFYAQVQQAGEQINADPLRSAWVKTASRHIMEVTLEEACKVPVPEMTGSLANDFLALFVMLPALCDAEAEYTRRGFSVAELTELFSAFAEGMEKVLCHTGHPGLNQGYYNWLAVFTKAKIFLAKGFWFELGQFPISAMWLKNKETGEILPLALRGPFTADGKQRVGSAGFETCENTFEIAFEETENAYLGHGVYDCIVSSQKEAFLKSQWECVGKPQDSCLSLHIPAGVDISTENLADAVSCAREIMGSRYPEVFCEVVYCSSWLLDPQLLQLAGEHSRLAAFGKCFARYPQKHNGMSVFGFVFPRYEKDYNNLPENTSLQRKLKQHYIDGKFIYFTAGIYKG